MAQTWPIRRQLRPAAQSCRLPCPLKGALRRWQGNQHHCLSVIDGQRVQSVGKAEYRHAKALGFGSLTHRAGYAIASSVTMRHFLSRAFVKKSHIVTCHQFDSRLSQSVAKAEYRHCQVAHKSSPVASQRWQHERRGAGYGSRLAGASCWHPGSTAVGIKWTPTSRQFFLEFKLVPFSLATARRCPGFCLGLRYPFLQFKTAVGKRSASGRRRTLVGKCGWELWGCGQAGRFASLSTCPQ